MDTIIDESLVVSPSVVVPSSILNTSSPPGSTADKRVEKPGTPPSSPNINYHITNQSNQYKYDPILFIIKILSSFY